MSNEQKRREHQRELAEQKHQEGLERFGKDPENDDDKSSQKLMFKKFVSYKKDTQIPNETKEIRVLVDRRNQSIILPIYGLAVPFHITTIKNVSKSEDLSQVFLRFNFQTPGQSLGKKDPTSIVSDVLALMFSPMMIQMRHLFDQLHSNQQTYTGSMRYSVKSMN